MDLILASTSRYRRALLERLGIAFSAVDPEVDEEVEKQKGHPPQVLAEILARAKATAVAAKHKEATVIGGDQLVAFDDQLLGKPHTHEKAVEQLMMVAGKTYELITAIAVVHRSQIVEHTDVARLTMRKLNREEIERYITADKPLDCSGSFRLESRGIMLFECIESADHSAITGLPLIRLTTILRNFGFAMP